MKAPAVAVLVQAWVSILFPLALISFQFFYTTALITFGSENRCSLNSPAHPSGLDGPNSSPAMQDCIFTMLQLFFLP
jgi:hypothetical protein